MRCDDCLDDLPSRHFLVIEEDDIDPEEGPDEKRLCADCAGWYGDQAVEVTE